MVTSAQTLKKKNYKNHIRKYFSANSKTFGLLICLNEKSVVPDKAVAAEFCLSVCPPLHAKLAKMKLTDNVVRNFQVAKVFRENNDLINSINFSATGDLLISSSDDDSIIIYDCQNGT